LVVGISRFDNFASLPTEKDPLRMRDFLIHEAGFDYVHMLTDEKATKTRIDELMQDILPAMIDENDQFLFYWSGHGETRARPQGGHLGYLPLASSSKGGFSTMVSMKDIQDWDELLEAKQALFLLDACFSGLAGHTSKAGPRDLQIDQLAKPAHHLISAGTGDEQTIAGDRWGGSIFTDAILRGVRGEADAETSYPRDGVVSLTELVGYVKTRVAFEADRSGWTRSITPQPRDLRTNDGEFFFLTSQSKVAKLEGEGADYQGRFEHGMPVVVMGATEEAPAEIERVEEPAGEAELMFWASIEDSNNPDLFKEYLKRFPDGVFAPIALEVLNEAKIAASPSSDDERPTAPAIASGLSAKKVPEPKQVAFAPAIVAPRPFESSDLAGRWEGRYRCQDDMVGMALEVAPPRGNRVEARFQFFPTEGSPSFPSGSFHIAGVFERETRRLRLEAGDWIERPWGKQRHDLEGKVLGDGLTIEGRVLTTGCNDFIVRLRS
jgi:Caspase domain